MVFKDKTILITGGTGSFGKSMAKTLLKDFQPQKVLIFSRDELKQFEMQESEFFKKYEGKLRYFLGDVRDLNRLKYAFDGVDFIIHAAALKQVPASRIQPI